MKPEVSILINNYNYAPYLPRAIDTALAQESVTAEVIVVDDGSSDNSREIIEGYGKWVRPVFQENAGQAAAINAGAAAARAPVLAFLDADDWWQPEKMAVVLEAFANTPEAGLVYHRLQPVYSDGRDAFRPIPRSLCQGSMAPRLLRSGGRWPFPMTSSLAVRRSAWDLAGAIPPQFRISADAWLTGIIPFLAPVVAIPQALGFYRIHNNHWYRAGDDRAMLEKRVAHWAQTIDVTNRELETRGMAGRVSLQGHFAYQAAAARLGLPGAPGALGLLRMGLRDAGEPNILRRTRDTLRAVAALRKALPQDTLAEAP